MFQAVANQVLRTGMALLLGAACALPGMSASARSALDAEVAAPGIALQELPPQGRTTYALILEGGPFPYDKDGAVFGNRERVLPAHKRGYYREYTVKTPRSRDRGARRIVCGGKQPQQPDACYYTSDHYSSFRKITP
ncbi:MAG: ribonuclease [Comamonas sp.]